MGVKGQFLDIPSNTLLNLTYDVRGECWPGLVGAAIDFIDFHDPMVR
jgi:hypothetical protein